MELVNNRYRIIRKLENTKDMLSFVVEDMKENNSIKQLNILDNKYISQDVLEYYLKEFIELSNLSTKCIVKVFDLGIVYAIDNNNTNKEYYYYTNEYVGTSVDTKAYIKNLTEEEIISQFVKIASSINYLHLRGMTYREININNLIVNVNEEDTYLKLKDMATVKFSKNHQNFSDSNQLSLNQVYKNKIDYFSEDIYALGILLLTLITINLEIPQSIFNALNQNIDVIKKIVNPELSNEFVNNIIYIISKVIGINENEYKNIDELIYDINKRLNKNYRSFDKSELEKLSFYNKIIGRDKELKNIFNTVKLSNNMKIIAVDGQAGIGKTRLLRETKYILKFSGYNVFSSFELGKNKNEKELYEVYRQLIAKSDNETLSEFGLELAKLFPNIIKQKNIKKNNFLAGDNEKFRRINRLISFIIKVIKNEKSVFILDNLHFANGINFEMLTYLFRNHFNKDITIIFSYAKEDINDNREFKEFLEFCEPLKIFSKVQLKSLNYDNTNRLIKSILNTNVELKDFVDIVYEKTYGNPCFIEETIKYLFNQKKIFIGEDGRWHKYVGSSSDLKIPSNLEQILLNQIKNINKLSKELLEILSVFNNGAKLTQLESVYDSKEELIKVLDTVISKGIVSKRFKDDEAYYKINNKILKKIIYDKIDNSKKKILHGKIGCILMQNNKNISEYEKTIEHFINAGFNDEANKLSILYADNMHEINNIENEIIFIEKALITLEKKYYSLERAELLLRISQLYFTNGEIEKAILNIKQCEEIATEIGNLKYKIDAMNVLIQIYNNSNRIEEAIELCEEVEEILKNNEYKKGLLETLYQKSIIYYFKGECKKSIDICYEGLQVCKEEELLYKGHFYNTIGINKYEISQSNEAIEAFEKSYKYFSEVNYYIGMVKTNVNIGVINFEIYENYEEAMKYFEKSLDICKNHDILWNKVVCLLNLGELSFMNLQLDKSSEFIKEALSISERADNKLRIFYCYKSLINLYLYEEKFKEAYEIYLKAEELAVNYPKHYKEYGVFYRIAAELNLEFGNLDKADELIKKSLEICDKFEGNVRNTILTVKQRIEIGKAIDTEDISNQVEKYIEITDKLKDTPIKKDNLYKMAILVADNNLKLASKIFNRGKKIKLREQDERLVVKELYLEVVLEDRSNLNKLLYAYKLANKLNMTRIQFEICTLLGKVYLEKGDIFKAINNLLESCDNVKELVLKLPKELRLNYVIFHKMQEPYEKLISIKRKYYDEMDVDIDNFKIKINSYEQFEKLFNYNEFSKLFKNQKFINSYIEYYKSIKCSGIYSVEDIIKSFSMHSLENLNMISRYIAAITLSKSCEIVVSNEENELEVIASSSNEKEKINNELIFNKVASLKKEIIINNENDDIEIFKGKNVYKCACIPIIVDEDEDEGEQYHKQNDRRSIKSQQYLAGYIYIETDKPYNNLNESSIEKCKEFNALLAFILEKHKLKIISSIDKLTGAYTRKYLEKLILQNIDKAAYEQEKFSIIMFDLDDFKMINDRYGHQTGDMVLKNVCSTVMNNIRKTDSCGRYGGEEFIVILPQVDEERALNIAEKLRRRIEKDCVIEHGHKVTASMGISTYPTHGMIMQELVEKADQALYAAKNSGKNRCLIYKREYSQGNKITDRLSGILNGNAINDHRNVLAMTDIIELIQSKESKENKIYELLGRIIEILEVQYGSLILINDDKIEEKFNRKAFVNQWVDELNCSEYIINSVIRNKKGAFLIDWDNIVNYDTITGEPNWFSIIAVPVIKSGILKGILYLSIPIKTREFKYEDFNFANILATLIGGIL